MKWMVVCSDCSRKYAEYALDARLNPSLLTTHTVRFSAEIEWRGDIYISSVHKFNFTECIAMSTIVKYCWSVPLVQILIQYAWLHRPHEQRAHLSSMVAGHANYCAALLSLAHRHSFLCQYWPMNNAHYCHHRWQSTSVFTHALVISHYTFWIN